jgi:exoribonuclease II
VTTDAAANITPDSQVATSQLGTPSITFGVTLELSGQATNSGVGAISPTAAADVNITGVNISTNPGFILVYGEIDTDQNASYAEISTTQTASYAEVSTSQSPSFSDVSTSQTASYSEVATTQTPNYTNIKAGRDAA